MLSEEGVFSFFLYAFSIYAFVALLESIYPLCPLTSIYLELQVTDNQRYMDGEGPEY